MIPLGMKLVYTSHMYMPGLLIGAHMHYMQRKVITETSMF